VRASRSRSALTYDHLVGVDISTLDPDGPDFDEWHAVYVEAYDRPFDCPWLAVEKKVNLTDDAYNLKIALAARSDGRIVGGGVALLPLQDNRTLAYLDVFVHPEERRLGHGRALLDALSAAAREAGRERLFIEAMWGIDDETSPAREFLITLGFEADLIDAVRQLDLPHDPPKAPVADGYTLHTWRGACPEQWIEEYADLRRRLVSEAPSGEIGLEEEYWDAERVRSEEADTVRSHRTMQVVVARHESGHIVGHTQLLFPGNDPEVYQWDTLVLPEHRGHGLGLTLKSAAMRAAADLLDGRRRIMTYNAASNGPMIAVNEQLGFRQVAWCGEFIRAA